MEYLRTTLLLLCLVNNVDCVPSFDIFSTNNLTYGRDYLYIQFRAVKTPTKVPVNLTIYKEVNENTTEIAQTDFVRTTWTNTELEKRVCSDTDNGSCASSFYFQLSTSTVNCTDTGSNQGKMEFSDGTMSINQVYIEVKVIPDHINPIKLLSGQNDSLPFPVGSFLKLQCSGNVGDPPVNLKWCIQRYSDAKSSNYEDSTDVSMGKPVLHGCQYTQYSNLTYLVSDKDRSTTVRCYAGDYGSCTDISIPFVEYKIKKATVNGGYKLGIGLQAVIVVMLTCQMSKFLL